MQRVTVADITRRVDQLLAASKTQIKTIVDTLTAEGRCVAALFDQADPYGMEIYRELGFDSDASSMGVVMDILDGPLQEAMRRHEYLPLDEAGYEPGTVLLYVFTMRVAVARRFETGGGPKLREVRRAREVQFLPGQPFADPDAVNLLVQKCGAVLKQLWRRDEDRVALIAEANHGAKVAYLTREMAITGLRTPTDRASAEMRESCCKMADVLAAGPTPGQVACVVHGWRSVALVNLNTEWLAGSGPESFVDRDEALLRERTAACRDPKRALGILKKCVEKMPPSSVSPLLAELVTLVRDDWQNCDAILEKIAELSEAVATAKVPDEGSRLFGALVALGQATGDRKRGRTIEAGDVKARFTEMIGAVRNSIADMGKAFAEKGTSATWAAVVFDRSDERGMQVYRKLDPTWGERAPKQEVIVIACALERLEEVVSALGYKRSPDLWGTREAGCVRAVAFTFRVLVVQNVRTIDAFEQGIA